MGDVANDVVLGIEDGQRRDALVVHKLKSLCQGSITIDGQDTLRSNVQVLQLVWVQLVDGGEALTVLPEELDQTQLCEDANDVCGALFGHEYPVHSTAKDFYGFGQVCRVGQGDERLLLAADLLDVFERNRLPFPSFLGKLVERGNISLVGVCKADDEQQICIEVAVVEGARRMARVCVFAEQNDIGRAVLDQDTRRVLDAGVVLDKPHQLRVDNLAQPDGPPITALEGGIAAFGRWVVQ